MTETFCGNLYAGMTGTGPVNTAFAPAATVQRMLDFEAALARAEARCGVIPAAVAERTCALIAAACRADIYDFAALTAQAAPAGNLAIPLVKHLTAKVSAANGEDGSEAAKYVHWGATSQDAIDTGLVLQLRDALMPIAADLDLLIEQVAALAETHAATVMVGRTWMQHALPITFGLKAAGWLDALLRHRERLAHASAMVHVLQFGGAAGTLASLGDQGLVVAQALAQELGLNLPALPWHTQRDRLVELASALALLTGTLGKIARDISLGMQTDVAEVSEPSASGRGGSSTMPHKRNPVSCASILAAAARTPGLMATMFGALVQEHERALGGWQAEWETLPQIVRLSAGALEQMTQICAAPDVNPVRMRANLDITNGLIMAEAVTLALGAAIGRQQAHHLVEQACRRAAAEHVHLGAVLRADRALRSALGDHYETLLSDEKLDALLDPTHYLGASAEFIARVLASVPAVLRAKPDILAG